MMILTEKNQENEISFDYFETDFNEILNFVVIIHGFQIIIEFYQDFLTYYSNQQLGNSSGITAQKKILKLLNINFKISRQKLLNM